MIAALSAAFTCALALLVVESRESRLCSAVALVWLAAAPLVRAPSAARAALITFAAALPFHGLALAADSAAGAPTHESLSIVALALAWSALLSAGAARTAQAERGGAQLGLWLCGAWLGPALSIASRSAGQTWEFAAWMNALSAPWWLLEHARLGGASSWSRELAGAAAPSALPLLVFALSARRGRLQGVAHGA